MSSSNSIQTPGLPRFRRLGLCAESLRDERTVARWWRHGSQPEAIQESIDRAAAKLGIARPEVPRG